MRNLSIGKKLTLTFAIVLILYAGALLIALLLGLQTVSDSFTGFYSGPHQAVTAGLDLRRSIQIIQKDMLKLLMENDASEAKEFTQEMDSAVLDFNHNLETLQSTLTRPENQARLQEIVAKQPVLNAAQEKVLSTIAQRRMEEAYAIYTDEYAPVAADIQALSIEISQSAQSVGDGYYHSAQETQREIIFAILAYFIASMALIIVLCIFIVRSITKPVREIEAAAKLLADGKLDARVTYTSKDEIGSLADSIRILIQNLSGYISDISHILGCMSDGDMTVSVDMEYRNDFAPIKLSMEQIIQSLHQTLLQISTSSQQVAAGSEQLASGAQSLSQGATEQASSAEELVASIGHVSERINQNAKNAGNASVNMEQTIQEIQRGDQQMKRLVSAMGEIAQTSGEIQRIVKTIDDIAFQTNILALNAAVEAARAGSAGRGFAVVAEEVRNLAGKSASAAKDTTSLIENTLSAIGNGNTMVVETERSLEQISVKASSVASLVEEIAAASQAQSAAIQQINAGINQISSVIQTNSATAEESAASSEELSAQAEMLETLVSQFKLNRDSLSGPQRAPQALGAPALQRF
ncbi:hypothetical protein SDC9_40426 [bioreactor metagenome]|uniref:Methyl-accepting chemotaxis protein III n=1 Tax=bioreactor metagenome TaxID=1076179 RepID=A0A644VS92_9ZZZZ